MFLRKRPLALAILLLLALDAVVFQALFAPAALSLSVLRVARGEAVLLRSPGGETFLINAGGDASVLRTLGEALPFWQRKLDALILTDTGSDEAGGTPEVLARYRVGRLLRTGARGSTSLENALAASRSTSLSRGMRLSLGGSAYADVLWPPERSREQPVMLRIVYGRSSILVGEAAPRETKWERELDKSLPSASLVISSSTPTGTYILDERGFIHE